MFFLFALFTLIHCEVEERKENLDTEKSKIAEEWRKELGEFREKKRDLIMELKQIKRKIKEAKLNGEDGSQYQKELDQIHSKLEDLDREFRGLRMKRFEKHPFSPEDRRGPRMGMLRGPHRHQNMTKLDKEIFQKRKEISERLRNKRYQMKDQ